MAGGVPVDAYQATIDRSAFLPILVVMALLGGAIIMGYRY